MPLFFSVTSYHPQMLSRNAVLSKLLLLCRLKDAGISRPFVFSGKGMGWGSTTVAWVVSPEAHLSMTGPSLAG